ncbi:hypothetical protein Nepgr_025003 [Nepenthes gracilis]|uniref:holo-[acyl-carrier-protein] synthase n=1 Tax=Nepenthes gracilis TaxID=150966 RepID=A0AAD3Y0M7_NEPGR|nr:hypothetical protein Nepgr_025003 [Nepenthes gracilis]
MPEEVNKFYMNEYLQILPQCEKDNVLSLREYQLRKRALLARALVRTTIARYQKSSRVDPKLLKFKKNVHGKPEVEWQHAGDFDQLQLHFNISHTTSLIACGITMNSPIGIDVEEKQRVIKNNILSFARRFFCPHEVEHLASICDPEDQRQEFIKLWTLKESYKLLSSYKNADFKASEILVKPVDHTSNLFARDFRFALLELAGTHYAAICVEKDNTLEEKEGSPMNLKVWKTIPLVEDECMSGTSSVLSVDGLINQLSI